MTAYKYFTNTIKACLTICKVGVLFILPAIASTNIMAEELGSINCPKFPHNYGPYDYRTTTAEQKVLVEGAHFFPNVEFLKKNTKHPNRGYIVNPGREIDYTLRAFPNHPRALLALSRWSFQEKADPPPGARAHVICYFKSAINFRPDDSLVRVVFGIHLSKKGEVEAALVQFDKAKVLGGESHALYYNMGLAYFDLKRYPEALEAAHQAYALGAQFPGLKTKLQSVGEWREQEKKPPMDEPVMADPPSPASPPSSTTPAEVTPGSPQ